MLKKLIFITCTFFCISSFSGSQMSRNRSENSIYNDVMQIAEKKFFFVKNDIDPLLLKNKFSIQELYNLLNKKEKEIERSIYKINIMKPIPQISKLLLPDRVPTSSSISVAGGDLVLAYLAGSLWLIGMPSLLLGINIQSSQNVKTINKVIGWALTAIGGILTLPGNILGLGLIAETIENKIIPIIDPQRKTQKDLQKLFNEKGLITWCIRQLRQLYPELSKETYIP